MLPPSRSCGTAEHVEERLGADGDDADLDQLVDRVASRPAAMNTRAIPVQRKKVARFEPARAVVEADAEDHRDGDADHGADEHRGCATVGGRGGRLAGEESDGLDPLADDCDERQDGQGRGGTCCRWPDPPPVRGAHRGRCAPGAASRTASRSPPRRRRSSSALRRSARMVLELADRLEQDDPEEGAQPSAYRHR